MNIKIYYADIFRLQIPNRFKREGKFVRKTRDTWFTTEPTWNINTQIANSPLWTSSKPEQADERKAQAQTRFEARAKCVMRGGMEKNMAHHIALCIWQIFPDSLQKTRF